MPDDNHKSPPTYHLGATIAKKYLFFSIAGMVKVAVPAGLTLLTLAAAGAARRSWPALPRRGQYRRSREQGLLHETPIR